MLSVPLPSRQTASFEVAHAGRMSAHTAEAEARRSETQRRQATARYAWRASDQPGRLTAETYANRIQPALANLTNGAIASALGVSRAYAAGIRRGELRPHPRHWRALAQLARYIPVCINGRWNGQYSVST